MLTTCLPKIFLKDATFLHIFAVLTNTLHNVIKSFLKTYSYFCLIVNCIFTRYLHHDNDKTVNPTLIRGKIISTTVRRAPLPYRIFRPNDTSALACENTKIKNAPLKDVLPHFVQVARQFLEIALP